MSKILTLLTQAAKLWYDKDADHLAAALAYYTPFALTPLLLFSVTMVGFFYGTESVVRILLSLGASLGPEIVLLLENSVHGFDTLTDEYSIPLLGTIFFSGMVIVAFNMLTAGLHRLWDVHHRGIVGWLEKSLRSIVFVFILQVYLIFIILLDGTVDFLIAHTGFDGLFVLNLFGFFFSTAFLFSIGYGVLSWAPPSFWARCYGGLVASLLFLTTKTLVTLHVVTNPIPGVYGTAGLVIVFLVWIYISASIVYFGAAFAKVYDDTLALGWKENSTDT